MSIRRMSHERITYDELMRAGHNKYAVTIAVAKRARQIHDGAPVMVDTDPSKSVSAALAEIMAGRILYGLGVVENPPKPVESEASAGDEEDAAAEATEDVPDSEDAPESEDVEPEDEAGE